MLMVIVWAVACYFIAKEVAKNNPGVPINPVAYGIGSFFFGFLGTMGYLVCKISKVRNNSKGNIIGILMIALAVVINIAMFL